MQLLGWCLLFDVGSTGALSAMMNKESAPVGKVKSNNTTAAPPQLTPTPSAAKFVPSVQKNRVIPGMPPPGAAPATAKKGNKKP